MNVAPTTLAAALLFLAATLPAAASDPAAAPASPLTFEEIVRWGNNAAKAEQALAQGLLVNEATSQQGFTPLLYAVSGMQDNPAVVQRLLAAGANPHVRARNSHASTPLLLASARQLTGSLAVLLQAGADPADRDALGNTGLHLALSGLDDRNPRFLPLDTLCLLYAAGADLNALNDRGESPLSLALAGRYLNHARLLLEWGAAPLTPLDPHADTLFQAAQKADREWVTLCLQAGLSINHAQQDGTTPLFAAAGTADSEFIQWMLQQHASPYDLRRTAAKPTVLFWALDNKESEARQHAALKTLLEARASIHINNQQPEGGDSVLMRAAEQDKASIVRLLREYGANIHAKDLSGRTPLARAVAAGAVAASQELAGLGARVDETDNSNLSILDHAVRLHKAEQALPLMRLLLQHGASPTGQTLFLASQSGTPEALSLLLEQGMDPNTANPQSSNTLLHLSRAACTDTLLKTEANPNQPNCLGYTPLHFAAMNTFINGGRETGKLHLLLAAGADVHARNSRGDTPLMVADFHCGDGEQAWEILLAAGADPFATNNEGQTTLMCAFRSGKSPAKADAARCAYIEALLRAGVDPRARDKQGRTALDYARKVECAAAIRRLEELEKP